MLYPRQPSKLVPSNKYTHSGCSSAVSEGVVWSFCFDVSLQAANAKKIAASLKNLGMV
jgi:hypothetical protein